MRIFKYFLSIPLSNYKNNKVIFFLFLFYPYQNFSLPSSIPFPIKEKLTTLSKLSSQYTHNHKQVANRHTYNKISNIYIYIFHFYMIFLIPSLSPSSTSTPLPSHQPPPPPRSTHEFSCVAILKRRFPEIFARREIATLFFFRRPLFPGGKEEHRLRGDGSDQDHEEGFYTRTRRYVSWNTGKDRNELNASFIFAA